MPTNTTPHHMYEVSVAYALKARNTVNTTKMAFELTRKFAVNIEHSWNLCLTPEETADDIEYEWLHKSQKMKPKDYLNVPSCAGHYKI